MSVPLSNCLIWKAAKGDIESLKTIIHAMKINIAFGHWSTFGCSHDPKCEPATNEEIDKLNEKIKEEIKDVKRGSHYSGISGPKGKIGEMSQL